SAVVTEALSNAVRHAQAHRVDITVTAASGQISVVVTDDGIGPGDAPRLSGLATLLARAAARGGWFEISPASAGGTRVAWTVPTSSGPTLRRR
ncbi:MAG: ATP-binding protein, partial [Aeromicrobium sp.]